MEPKVIKFLSHCYNQDLRTVFLDDKTLADAIIIPDSKLIYMSKNWKKDELKKYLKSIPQNRLERVKPEMFTP